MASGRFRGAADTFCMPEALLSRVSHAWVIDARNDRILLPRIG